MASEAAAAAKPQPTPRYSDKLAALISFLEHDIDDDCSGSVIGKDGRPSSGLVDITNRTTTSTARAGGKNPPVEPISGENAKEISSATHFVGAAKVDKRSKLALREKKYIWDDWESDSLLASLGACFEKIEMADDEHSESGEEVGEANESSHPQREANESSHPQRSSKTVPANAAQQLQELKSMSEEIQSRASTMRATLEEKRKKVEELHAIRVQNESAHVQKMKAAKQEWKKRIDAVKSENEKVSALAYQ